jgi:predicted nucleic-acid-binding protein
VRGLDTNILVRFFIQDDPEQTQTVLELLEQTERDGEKLHVTPITLCELVWVLGSVYRQNRRQTSAALESLLDIRLLEIQDRELVLRALDDVRTGPAEFSDYLIGWQNRQAGCVDTITFDGGLRTAPGFTHLR